MKRIYTFLECRIKASKTATIGRSFSYGVIVISVEERTLKQKKKFSVKTTSLSLQIKRIFAKKVT